MPIGYWETEHLLRPADHTVVGAGIVGMSTALQLKRARPDSHVRLLERSPISAGGTTRNAGFACFGSAGEWLDDLEALGAEQLGKLIRMRAEGLTELVNLLGADAIGLKWTGGWELLGNSEGDTRLAKRIQEALHTLQTAATPLLQEALANVHPKPDPGPALVLDSDRANRVGANMAIALPWEGMLHTGRMVSAFHRALDAAGVQRIHGIEVQEMTEGSQTWAMDTSMGTLHTKNVGICTNGLAAQLVEGLDVQPVPNRVLVLKVPVGSLPVGTYHLDQGYLYMRTLDEHHILFGGGRHWGIKLPLPPERDCKAEAQWDAQLLVSAKKWLEVEKVTHMWTGWLGVGSDRRPLIGESRPGLHHAVRMGGMGVAIGAGIGRELATNMLGT
ncbi:MAG: hypothetical protein CL849_05240 [Crocinitomicaceae bacterium]|nr:hypothetical protein [Crocinitomicaceae bacterium]